MGPKLIAQGAEAKIFLNNKGNVVKDRIPKSYRLEELDNKIRKSRTKKEVKLLEKASKIIPTPKVINSDENTISLEFINGEKLSEHLDNFPLNKQKQISNQIGQNISKLHQENIIHGDLTTSNMILKDKEIFFIDFGLGFSNGKIEDKAVDLHLLKQALKAKHFKHWEELFKEIEKGYLSINHIESEKVLQHLKTVEKRGRYKDKY